MNHNFPELHWYYSRGQNYQQGSATGAMIDRLQLYGFDESGARIPLAQQQRVRLEDGQRVPVSYDALPGSGGHREASVHVPDDAYLQAFARVSRRLARVPVAAQEVLERYFGNEGDRWGRTEAGAILSLYPMTRAGQKILAQSRESAENPELEEALTPCERIYGQWALEKTQPKPWRTAAFAAASVEAYDRLGAATLSYRAARDVAA